MFAAQRLDAVCEVSMGQAPDGGAYNDEGDGWPLIAGAGDFGELYPAPKKYTSEASKLSKPGDIILGIRATIGEKVLSDGEYCLGRGVAGLRAKANLEARYLWHWIEHVRPTLAAKSKGATFKQVNKQDIGELEIALPPLPEQRRIAAILDQADALRAKRREALAQLNALTQSIFIEMFGDLASGNSDWPEVTLEDVTDTLTGFAFRSDEYVDSKANAIRLCRGANVLPGRVDWSDTAWWPIEKISGLEAFQLAAGDIVIAMDRPWISEGFKITQVSREDCPSLLVQRVTRIRGNERAKTGFIFHLLSHPAFSRHCKPTETTVPHISPKEIRAYKFCLPSLSLQTEFCQKISAVEVLVERSKSAIEQADALFSSLQHRAFRGEL